MAAPEAISDLEPPVPPPAVVNPRDIKPAPLLWHEDAPRGGPMGGGWTPLGGYGGPQNGRASYPGGFAPPPGYGGIGGSIGGGGGGGIAGGGYYAHHSGPPPPLHGPPPPLQHLWRTFFPPLAPQRATTG